MSRRFRQDAEVRANGVLRHAFRLAKKFGLPKLSALGKIPVDSTTDGTKYFVADVELRPDEKSYRMIWLFEGDRLEVIGVVNAYRRASKKEKKKERSQK